MLKRGRVGKGEVSDGCWDEMSGDIFFVWLGLELEIINTCCGRRKLGRRVVIIHDTINMVINSN